MNSIWKCFINFLFVGFILLIFLSFMFNYIFVKKIFVWIIFWKYYLKGSDSYDFSISRFVSDGGLNKKRSLLFVLF